MYENASTLKLHSGRLDQAIGILREQILPLLKSQPGLIHLAIVPDRINDRLTVISLWASAADAVAVERKGAYLRALGELDPLLKAVPELPWEAVNPLHRSPKIILN